MNKRLLTLSMIIFLFIGIVAPLSVSSAQISAAPQVSTSTRFRVVIAAPLSASVDVYLDGAITSESGLAAVKPLNVSGYIVTIAGSHTISLDQTGTTTAVGSPFSTSFTAGTNYTLILLSDMTWLVITDANSAPASGMFNARVVNLSAHNDPVNVQVDTAVPPMFSSIAYKSTSPSYFSGVIGIHTLFIPGSTSKTISYNFQDGHVYSIFVFWDPTKNSPIIIPKSDTTYLKTTPTVGATSTLTPSPTTGITSTSSPTPTVDVTGTPGPNPTVGVTLPPRLWLPLIDHP
ncbi:MAG: DUF4397 domain-containing protein [Anaerolineaceae bacterium]|nr:DUF4397 domain-containing protein [Anaerolineaceae bacterium]